MARTLERDWETALSRASASLWPIMNASCVSGPSASPVELVAVRSTRIYPRSGGPRRRPGKSVKPSPDCCSSGVIVTVIGGSEQVRLECHWHGGNRTAHRLARPVAKLKALSTYPDLVARVCELRRRGHNCVAIAAILNHEGWRSPKRRDSVNRRMVRHRVDRRWTDRGQAPTPRPTPNVARRMDDHELAAEIKAPAATIYHSVQKDDSAAARSKFTEPATSW